MTMPSEQAADPPGAGPDADADDRRRLVSLAYRLLGSLADAEDAVQEAYARWYARTPEQQDEIASPAAWLTTVTSRICLDVLRSARTRRERYVGQWLPEPVPESREPALGHHPGEDPADRITLDESVSMAFLVVLDAMTPAERVAFVLHDVFRYPFAEIGRVVGRTPEACRQLASSARRRLRSARTAPAPADRQADLVRRFKEAWAAQDVDALVGLLDPDAVVIADGGGVVQASVPPIEGAEQIARYYVGLARLVPTALELEERPVNGQPGLVAYHGGVAVTVFAFGVSGDRITHVWAVRNPEKLRAWRTTTEAGPR